MSERTDYRECLSQETLHAELVEAERLRDFYRNQAWKAVLAFLTQTALALALLVVVAGMCGGAS